MGQSYFAEDVWVLIICNDIQILNDYECDGTDIFIR